jgi:hypothetical protein
MLFNAGTGNLVVAEVHISKFCRSVKTREFD